MIFKRNITQLAFVLMIKKNTKKIRNALIKMDILGLLKYYF